MVSQFDRNNLPKTSGSLESMIQELKERVFQLESEVQDLKLQNELFDLKLKRTLSNASTTTNDNQSSSSPPSTIQKTNKNISSFAFIDAYNSLSSSGNFRQARDEFITRFKARGFSCKNFYERTNQPSITPVFEDSSSPQVGNYLAIPLKDNKYAVLPNIMTYNENDHGAMDYVFKSNFDGSVYSKISVKSAAIFEYAGGNWKRINMGELLLG